MPQLGKSIRWTESLRGLLRRSLLFTSVFSVVLVDKKPWESGLETQNNLTMDGRSIRVVN